MITVTDSASTYIRNFLVERGKGIGIRLKVVPNGCSGLSYVLEPVDLPEAEDNLFTSNHINVYVDPKSLLYVTGTDINYTSDGIMGGFEFSNPNVQSQCGCGESFTVK